MSIILGKVRCQIRPHFDRAHKHPKSLDGVNLKKVTNGLAAQGGRDPRNRRFQPGMADLRFWAEV